MGFHVLLASFREWITAHLPRDREMVVEAICGFCLSSSGPDGLASPVLAAAVWCGLRDERVFAMLIAELPHDPVSLSAALELYGDRAAVPSLEALLDRQPEQAHDRRAVRALVRAIVALGGLLTFGRAAKLIAVSGDDAAGRFWSLADQVVDELRAEPNALDVLARPETAPGVDSN